MYGLKVPLTKLGELEHGFINDTRVLKCLETVRTKIANIHLKTTFFSKPKYSLFGHFYLFLIIFESFLMLFECF